MRQLHLCFSQQNSLGAGSRGGRLDAKDRAIAEHVGRRFVTSSETDQGQRLHEARVKQLTGMGKLLGRKIYGSPFEFDPMFKLFLDANHKPEIRGTDQAIWSRIRLIPFNVSIPKAEQDRKLGEKLGAELAGVFAWAVEGCMKWQKEGLGAPAAVALAGETYRGEMDAVEHFIAESCVRGPEFQEPFADLHQAYLIWCKDLGEVPLKQRAFAEVLETKGFAKGRTAESRYRKGLKLLTANSGFGAPGEPTVGCDGFAEG